MNSKKELSDEVKMKLMKELYEEMKDDLNNPIYSRTNEYQAFLKYRFKRYAKLMAHRYGKGNLKVLDLFLR